MCPDVLGEVRGHGRHELRHGLHRLALRGAGGLRFRDGVGEGVELRDGAVEAEAFDPHRHVVDRAVHGAQEVLVAVALFGGLVHLGGEAPDAGEVAVRGLGPGGGPFDVAFGRAVGQDEPARGVGAVGRDDAHRVDDVLLRLRHLGGGDDLHRLAGGLEAGGVARDLDRLGKVVDGRPPASFVWKIAWVTMPCVKSASNGSMAEAGRCPQACIARAKKRE
jgi:hypothetical protein